MSNNMSIYLISLQKDVYRRESLKKIFGSHYEKMKLIDAVYGSDLSQEFVINATRGYFNKYHKQMSPGELGCTLSHIKALENFLASDSSIGLILEDDVIGSDSDIEKIEGLKISVDDNIIVNCGSQQYSGKAKYLLGKNVPEYDELMLIPKPLYSNLLGAFSYVVTKKSAQTILNSHKKFIHVADHWGDILLDTDTKVYYINLFQHPDPDFCDSNLNYDRGSGYHNKGRKVFFSILKEIMRTYRRLEVLFYKSLGYVNVKV